MELCGDRGGVLYIWLDVIAEGQSVGGGDTVYLVFEDHLHDLIESYNLKEITFIIGKKKTWVVQIEEMAIHGLTFAQFVMGLELQPLDYMMVVVSYDLEFRVIVLNLREECEKLYQWFDEVD